MNRILCLYILWLSIFCPEIYGQNITFDQPHPITYLELKNPLIPSILSNSRKNYFIKHVYNDQVSYGGLLPKRWITLGSELLSFYKDATLFHLDIQKQSALIGTDTTSHTTYYTSSEAHSGQFEGLFMTQPYQHRIKKLSLPGFNVRDIHSFCFSETWDILVFSTQRKDGVGREDLYVSLLSNGNWTAPVSLGVSVNTEGAEVSPFLSQDTKRLFFSSDGHGGYGQGDLFVTERLYDSWQVWGRPLNLGKNVNSSGYEAYLSIMEDSIAYFFSEADGQGKLWTARVAASPPHGLLKKNTDTRQYMSKDEVQHWLEAAVDTTLSFVADDIALTRNSQESLWFIANRMVNNPEIHINVSFFPQSTDDRTKAKSVIVRNYLVQLGVDKERIAIRLLTDRFGELPDKGEATFNFFRTKQSQ